MSCETNMLIVLIVLLIVFGVLWLFQQKPKELYYYNNSVPSSPYAQLNTAYNPYLYSPSLQNKNGYIVSDPHPVRSTGCCNSPVKTCGSGEVAQRSCSAFGGNKGLQGRPFVFDYSNITDFNCSDCEPASLYNDESRCAAPTQTTLCSL